VRLTFLGTGTSFGVPVVGCDCQVCTSADPRDHRTRHGALVSWDDGSALLVDTPPELRLQLLREGVNRVDAVWFTHGHADHVHGIDDLRIFSLRTRKSIPVFVSSRFREEMAQRFRYIFDPDIRPDRGSSKPELDLHEVEGEGEGPVVMGRRITPLPVPHGSVTVLGFRVGDLGYVTDAKTLPAGTLERLRGVRLLVLNALWFGNPHPSHFNVEEAVAMAERVGAERTYLTHLTHRTSHAELERRLPSTVRPAWDGLAVQLDGTRIQEISTPSPDPPSGGLP
jgi:phosphoribosyl 1,2-cyclic phosphate phosphodiesterase